MSRPPKSPVHAPLPDDTSLPANPLPQNPGELAPAISASSRNLGESRSVSITSTNHASTPNRIAGVSQWTPSSAEATLMPRISRKRSALPRPTLGRGRSPRARPSARAGRAGSAGPGARDFRPRRTRGAGDRGAPEPGVGSSAIALIPDFEGLVMPGVSTRPLPQGATPRRCPVATPWSGPFSAHAALRTQVPARAFGPQLRQFDIRSIEPGREVAVTRAVAGIWTTRTEVLRLPTHRCRPGFAVRVAVDVQPRAGS